MCATNVWAIGRAAYTPDFARFTRAQIGATPQLSDYLIASSRVRQNAVTFTLTRNMCDCSSLVGLRDGAPSASEASAAAWLSWITGLPQQVPFVGRIAVLRAWSPAQSALVPVHAKGVTVDAVDEGILRSLRDDSLLTIDYPAER